MLGARCALALLPRAKWGTLVLTLWPLMPDRKKLQAASVIRRLVCAWDCHSSNMAARRAVSSLGLAQRGMPVFWGAACRSGCNKACCAVAPLARAYAAVSGGNAPAVVHPPQQSLRTAYAPTDTPHTAKWMEVRCLAVDFLLLT